MSERSSLLPAPPRPADPAEPARRGRAPAGPRGRGRPDRPYRGLRRALAVVCLVVVTALPAASSAPPTSGTMELRVVQMNLCNSGRAGCYTGRSMTEAARTIRAEAPDVVTLNEICADDLTTLERTFGDVHHGGRVVSAFTAAGDRPSGDVTRCRNGRPFGIGMLVRLPAPHREHTVHHGIHPTQDLTDPEERAWLCVHVARVVQTCTTHLSAFDATVALAQCGHLLDTVVPQILRRRGHVPTVVGGDLNLRQGGQADVASCVPPRHRRIDDGAVQQIVVTADVAIRSRRTVDMRGSTDHPGLLATLTVDLERPGWSAAAPR